MSDILTESSPLSEPSSAASPEKEAGPKKLLPPLLAGVLALFCFLGLSMLYVANEIKSFRTSPTRSVVVKHFLGGWPHNYLGRALILKPGTDSYDSTVRSWLYREGNLRDDLLNRWLIRRDVARMSLEERIDLLPSFDLDGEIILASLEEAILSAPEGCQLLPLLPNNARGESIARTWTATHLKDTPSTVDFVECLPKLVHIPAIVTLPEIAGQWRRMSADDVSWTLELLFDSVVPEQVDLTPLLSVLAQRVVEGELDFIVLAPTFGKALSTASVEQRKRTMGILSQIEHIITPSELEALFDWVSFDLEPEVARSCFATYWRKRPELAEVCFPYVAQGSVTEAEALARKILSGPDSILRKSVIISLVNSNSSVGLEYLDEAFRGNAPRKRLIEDHHAFIVTSSGTGRYEEIAGHGYTETGKLWPPAGIYEQDHEQRILQWEEFIDEFRWFPGTDDAYYRLAYHNFLAGHDAGAIRTIFEFCERDLPDRDSQVFILRLLLEIGSARSVSKEEFPALAHFDILSRVGLLILQPEPHLAPVHNALAWFRERPLFADCFGLQPEDLNLVEEIVLAVEASPPIDRFTVLRTLIGSSFADAIRLPLVLYGGTMLREREIVTPALVSRVREAGLLLRSWQDLASNKALADELEAWANFNEENLPAKLITVFSGTDDEEFAVEAAAEELDFFEEELDFFEDTPRN